MSTEWFYSTNGAQNGPVPIENMKRLIQSGSIKRETLVWNETMASWTPAGQVRELFAAPPPLPSNQPARPAPPPLPPPPITPPKAPARRSTRLAFEDAAPAAPGGQPKAPTQQEEPKSTTPPAPAPLPSGGPVQESAPSSSPRASTGPLPPSPLWVLVGLLSCIVGAMLSLVFPIAGVLGLIAAAAVVGWFVHRSWATLPAAHRSIQPRNAVLLTLIPVVNVYGIWRAVRGLTIETHRAVLKKRPMTACSTLATYGPWLCVTAYLAGPFIAVFAGGTAPIVKFLWAAIFAIAILSLPIAFGYWALEQARLAHILADIPLNLKLPRYLHIASMVLIGIAVIMFIPHVSLPYMGPVVPVIARPVCLKCKGTGHAGRCSYCQGYGQVMGAKCSFCNGTGMAKCNVCGGSGLGPGRETFLGDPPFTEVQAYAACKTYVYAQDLYFRTDWDNDRVKEYAQNGRGSFSLYEKSAQQGDLQLIDQAFADALASPGQVERNGYFFKILHRRGPNASGGAREFIVNGNMTQGHALLAYPAHYGVTGVNSYMIDAAETIYYQDLGPETVTIANGIDAFDPDPTWQEPAEVPER